VTLFYVYSNVYQTPFYAELKKHSLYPGYDSYNVHSNYSQHVQAYNISHLQTTVPPINSSYGLINALNIICD